MAKFDVVMNYDWTSEPKNSILRKKSPKIKLKSYKLVSNQILQTIKNYTKLVTGGDKSASQFYMGLYKDSVIEEDDFIFPFFSDEIRGFSNSFTTAFQSAIEGANQPVGDTVKSDIENIVSATAEFYQAVDRRSNNPGSYIERPKFYEYNENDNELSFNFILSNTLNSESINNNYELVKKLTKINRPTRLGVVAMDAPRIYKVNVKGYRYIPWAYCSSFSVNFIGTRREINNKIIPEAYDIKMSLKSLTIEHSGFIDEAT